MNYRPISGKWVLPNGGNPERAIATLSLVAPDWTPEALVVPDVVRLVVDADGDVVPARGYTGATVVVDGKARAVVWASEDGERQVLYRVAIGGELSTFEVAEVLIPSGTAPLTLQEIIELGISPEDPRYVTLLTFIAELFRGDWDPDAVYLRGQQVRRGAAVYIASEDIPAGVDPLLGDPWETYLIDAGIPAGGDTNAVLAKLSPASSDAGWTNTPTFTRLAFDTANPASLDAPGQFAWDDLDQTLSFRTDGLTVDLAQENLVYVRNPNVNQGGVAITKGQVVSVSGAAANRLQVAPCSATAGGEGCRTLGVAMTNIPTNSFGFVSTFGLLRAFNTTQILGTVTEGAEVFVSATPGVLTTTVPEAPARKVTVGYVVTTGANGSIFITVRRSRRVGELDDVHAPSPAANQVLRRNSGNTRWEPATLGTAADQPSTAFDPSGSAAAVQGNLDSHTGATTSVHGIANTADLVVTTDARLSDQRIPTNGSVTDAKITAGGLSPSKITGTAVITTDARLSDQRTPTDGSVTDAKVATGANIAPSKIAGTAVVNNDARLTDQRTPTDGSVTDAKIVGGGLSPTAITGTAVITSDGRLTDSRTPLTHGNEAHSATYVDAAGASAAAPVQSVNTQTGAVVLDAAAVGADPAGSASAVQSNLASHTGATTSVHGIANTADLVVTSDARLSDARTPTDGSVTDAKITGGGLSPTAITGTAVITTDSRLTDNRTPSDGSVTDTKIVSGGLSPTVITGTAVIDSDARLTNSRTPTTHGNEAHSATYVDAAGAAAAAPVQSVQGQTGAVTFAATITDEGTYYAITPGA